MLVKDEADIIDYTIRQLAEQVDAIIVSDNGSTDGTYEAVASNPAVTLVVRDAEVGYWQDRKTTALAQAALRAGHEWVLPCDADEFWYAPDGRTISDYLDGTAPDVRIVTGALFNHLPTALDDAEESNPFRRIEWRQRSHGALPKVCARLTPDLQIHMGNHGATFDGRGLTVPGLIVRHFSWRDEEQYVRKIRNGEAAYAATDMPESTGGHWRMFAGADDDAIRAHFRRWFHVDNPYADPSLILDPAPGV
jgi:glycosyltransferase involved in cell wall biosynthesis